MRDLERTRDTTTTPFECSQMSDLGTLKEYLSLVGFGGPGEDIEHGRFAGAVWTDHANRYPSLRCMLKLSIASSEPKRLETPLSLRIALIVV